MKVLIVYDSVFGNTERVAQAMGQALAARAEVQTCRVGEVSAAQMQGLDVLIAGAPTRQFRPTPAMTAFLDGLAAGSLKGVRVAAFDTRLSLSDIGSSVERFFVRMGGYAGKHIAAKLQRARGELVALPEGFLVTGEKGPLKDGEIARAAQWAGQILVA
jgi:flavodoxin I